MTTHYIEQLNSCNNSVFKLLQVKLLLLYYMAKIGTNSLGKFIFYAQMICYTHFLEQY